MSYTLTETGKVLTETQEGITIPADYSFATVNDYVHGVEVSFEDLVALCLGMACEIENRELREKLTRSMDVYREHVWELVHLRTKLELVTMALNGETEE